MISSAAGVFTSLLSNRYLAWQLTKRGVLSRYSGSMLGATWSFFQPLLMLGLYSFVFSVVMKARWPDTGEHGGLGYTVVLFAGLIMHGLFSECLGRAPGLIVGTPNYVKKMIFPLDVLPWTVIGSSLIHAGASFLLLLIMEFAVFGYVPLTAFLLPIVVLPYILLLVGIVWGCSALGVFFRDMEQMVGVASSILLFFSPIFFPISALPTGLQSYVYLNPLTFMVEQVRAVMIWGQLPNWYGLALYSAIAYGIAWFGYYGFTRLRRAFADVI